MTSIIIAHNEFKLAARRRVDHGVADISLSPLISLSVERVQSPPGHSITSMALRRPLRARFCALSPLFVGMGRQPSGKRPELHSC